MAQRRAVYLTQGRRQYAVDVWSTHRPPVLHRGNWKHPAHPEEPKCYWPPLVTISMAVCVLVFGKLPPRSQALQVRPKRSAIIAELDKLQATIA